MIMPLCTSSELHKQLFLSAFEQLNHPPYSPDLAPSDYYLFRNLKSHLRGTRFQDDDELKAATEAWFEDQIEDFYFKGIDCLKEK